MTILMFGLLESKFSKPTSISFFSFREKNIHTLENKVLMHQCAIAQRISTYTLNNFEQLLQQEKQASWLALPLWGGMGEAVLISSYSRTRIVIEGS